jgi:Holliday junction resolvase
MVRTVKMTNHKIQGCVSKPDKHAIMRTPEGYEKDDICKYLDSIGAWYFKTYMAGYGKRGVPDIVACIRGVFWGIEVKREGKEPTPIQWKRMEEIQKAGGRTAYGTAAMVIETLRVNVG